MTGENKTEEDQYLLQFQHEILRIKRVKDNVPTVVAKSEHRDDLTKNMEYINPLLYPVIVENLMQYLNLSNLVKCREVCKIWERGALKNILMTKIFRLNLEIFGKIDEFLLLTKTKFQNFKGLDINLDCCDLLNSARQLHEILTLYGPKLIWFSYTSGNFGSSFHAIIIRDLILKHLEKVEYLAINNFNCDGYLHTPLFSPEAITRQQLCNLKSLQLGMYHSNICRNTVEHDIVHMKTPMADILKMSSKLTIISFEHFTTISHNWIDLSVKEICCFNPANLRKLKFGAPVLDCIAEQLVNSKLRLDCLTFHDLSSFELILSKTFIKIEAKAVFYSGLWCVQVVDKLNDAISIYTTKNIGIEYNAINYLRTFCSARDTILRVDN